ncbi:MAG: hypothetical protein J5804_00995 [Eggerthellaceae bacterium]|nr:hypothetical protein [Eggerthellaceae bacterium]
MGVEFSKEQKVRYRDTMNELLSFTNACLGICRHFEPPIETTEQALHGLRIALDLWERPSIVELYLEQCERPSCNHADFETARQWRNALRGPFFVKSCRGYCAEFLYHETLFEVWSMNRMWDDMIRHTPDIVYTTLIPFDGLIVSDGFLLNHGCSACGPGLQRLGHQRAKALAKGVVTSAEEFARVAETLNAERKSGLMEVNDAAIFMDYVERLNDSCEETCIPYGVLESEVPKLLRPRNNHSRVLNPELVRLAFVKARTGS